MAALNLHTGGLHAALKSDVAVKSAASLDRLSSAKNIGDLFFSDLSFHRKRVNGLCQIVAVKSPDHIRGANNNVHASYDDDDNSNFNLPLTSSVSQSSFVIDVQSFQSLNLGISTLLRKLEWNGIEYIPVY